MNFQRIKINREMSEMRDTSYSFAKPCLKIKKIIEEDYSSFFSKFFDSVYVNWFGGNSDNIDISSDTYQREENYIDFKKDNTVLFSYKNLGSYNNYLAYDIFQYIYSKCSLWRPTSNRGIINSDQTIGTFKYSNFISEILLINDTTFAFTFENVNDGNEIYRSPGIIIFTITNNGNIAMIQPSNTRTAVKIPISETVIPVEQYNHLYCATIESVDATMSYPNIYFGPTLSEKTVLSPIMVIGDDDYCPTCYTVSMAQFTMNHYSDAIIEIEGLPFYYNGFIAVQLDH
jgi:hypothetical protein